MMAKHSRSNESDIILLVQDYQPLLRNMAFLLEVAGYTVLTARDGMEALDILENQIPNLIISDTVMPNLDGYDLLRCVRAEAQWGNIPFIITSDKYDLNDLLYALDLGADDCVPMPFDIHDLLTSIRMILPPAARRQLKPSA